METESFNFQPFFDEVLEELRLQDIIQGERHMPNGTSAVFLPIANQMKEQWDRAETLEATSWMLALLENSYRVISLEDPEATKRELIHALATGFAWLRSMEKRKAPDVRVKE